MLKFHLATCATSSGLWLAFGSSYVKNISRLFYYPLHVFSFSLRSRPLSTYAKFSRKLTFLTPWYARTCAYQGVKNLSFSENFNARKWMTPNRSILQLTNKSIIFCHLLEDGLEYISKLFSTYAKLSEKTNISYSLIRTPRECKTKRTP